MNPPDPFTQPLTGCDAVQAQLSELADSGAPLPPEIRAHLNACQACAEFAATWLQGPPAALLASPVSAGPHDALRERILDAAMPLPPNIVQFSSSTDSSRVFPKVWLSRIAAVLVVAGLAYWLMDPKHSTGVRHRPVVAAQPTLSQDFLRTETHSKHEQQAVQTALVDGGREVHNNVAWAVSALEL